MTGLVGTSCCRSVTSPPPVEFILRDTFFQPLGLNSIVSLGIHTTRNSGSLLRTCDHRQLPSPGLIEISSELFMTRSGDRRTRTYNDSSMMHHHVERYSGSCMILIYGGRNSHFGCLCPPQAGPQPGFRRTTRSPQELIVPFDCQSRSVFSPIKKKHIFNP